MTPNKSGMCEVCGKLANVHLAEIQNGVKKTRSLCMEHVPPELRDKMPFGPHSTPTEEVALLREKLTLIDQRITDPAQRAEAAAEIEKLMEAIESGKRRLFDPD